MSIHDDSAREEPGAADFQTMLGMITGFWVSRIVATYADLSIAEHLGEGPLPASEIAARAGTDPAFTYRLLRAGVTLGLLSHTDGRFTGTQLLGTLRAGAPNSLRHLAQAMSEHAHWQTWSTLTEAVRTGTSQADTLLGKLLWEYFQDNPAEGRLFSLAVTELSMPVITEVVPVLDVTGVRDVVDVGGANGVFVLSLMAEHEHLRGSVLELPHSLRGAETEAAKFGLAQRFSAVGGDFFEAVPPADLYLLKYIMHDWNDEECVAILRNCRDSLRAGGRVALVDIVLGEAADPGIGALMDLNMLTMLTGRERNLAEFDQLLEKAGLRRTKTTSLQAPYALIEAEAA